MKRSELTLDAELYYARPYEWVNDQLGDRAVVVATEPHCEKPPEWGFRGDRIAKVNTGTGVLVDRYREYGASEKPERTVVPLGHLRGPYAETKAEVEKRADEKRRALESERERRDRQSDIVRAILDRAKRNGFDVWNGVSGTASRHYHTVTMTPETLERMLTLIEKGE